MNSSCPECDYAAILDPSQMIFECPECHHESCRKCKKKAHVPLKCEEVQEEEQTSARVRVEEAISKAKIRKCPDCSTSFIKSDGCNQIHCGCGIYVCYLCQTKVPGDHSHFCWCSDKSCNRCHLFTANDDMDKKAMRAAATKEVERIHKEEAAAANDNTERGNKKRRRSTVGKTGKVDVEKILTDPFEKKKEGQ